MDPHRGKLGNGVNARLVQPLDRLGIDLLVESGFSTVAPSKMRPSDRGMM